MPITRIPPTGQREIEFFTGNLFKGLHLAGQLQGLNKKSLQEQILEGLLQQGQFERGIGQSLGGGGPLPQAPTSPLAGFPRETLEILGGIREKKKAPRIPTVKDRLSNVKSLFELGDKQGAMHLLEGIRKDAGVPGALNITQDNIGAFAQSQIAWGDALARSRNREEATGHLQRIKERMIRGFSRRSTPEQQRNDIAKFDQLGNQGINRKFPDITTQARRTLEEKKLLAAHDFVQTVKQKAADKRETTRQKEVFAAIAAGADVPLSATRGEAAGAKGRLAIGKLQREFTSDLIGFINSDDPTEIEREELRQRWEKLYPNIIAPTELWTDDEKEALQNPSLLKTLTLGLVGGTGLQEARKAGRGPPTVEQKLGEAGRVRDAAVRGDISPEDARERIRALNLPRGSLR